MRRVKKLFRKSDSASARVISRNSKTGCARPTRLAGHAHHRPSARATQSRALVLAAACAPGAEKIAAETAEALWVLKKIAEPLVSLPATSAIMQTFQRDLKRRGVSWRSPVEATSIEVIHRYVAAGRRHRRQPSRSPPPPASARSARS